MERTMIPIESIRVAQMLVARKDIDNMLAYTPNGLSSNLVMGYTFDNSFVTEYGILQIYEMGEEIPKKGLYAMINDKQFDYEGLPKEIDINHVSIYMDKLMPQFKEKSYNKEFFENAPETPSINYEEMGLGVEPKKR